MGTKKSFVKQITHTKIFSNSLDSYSVGFFKIWFRIHSKKWKQNKKKTRTFALGWAPFSFLSSSSLLKINKKEKEKGKFYPLPFVGCVTFASCHSFITSSSSSTDASYLFIYFFCLILYIFLLGCPCSMRFCSWHRHQYTHPVYRGAIHRTKKIYIHVWRPPILHFKSNKRNERVFVSSLFFFFFPFIKTLS